MRNEGRREERDRLERIKEVVNECVGERERLIMYEQSTSQTSKDFLLKNDITIKPTPLNPTRIQDILLAISFMLSAQTSLFPLKIKKARTFAASWRPSGQNPL